MGVVAPYVGSEGVATPYVSLTEVKFSPTAGAIDFSNLVGNASQSVQDRALYELIKRASSMADVHIYGKFGTLSATQNTENGRTHVNRLGQIVVHPYFTPILELVSFAAGYGPGSALEPATLSSNNVEIEREQFVVTTNVGLGPLVQFGSLNLIGGSWSTNNEVFVQYTYVNGFPNTFSTASMTAGSTTMSVASTVGIYPGSQLMIWDGMNDEPVIVSTVGTNSVTFASPVAYNHGVGCNLSSIPAVVKQAVIHLVVGLIKQRGQGGLVLNELGEPTPYAGSSVMNSEDLTIGYALLEEFKAVWGRS